MHRSGDIYAIRIHYEPYLNTIPTITRISVWRGFPTVNSIQNLHLLYSAIAIGGDLSRWYIWGVGYTRRKNATIETMYVLLGTQFETFFFCISVAKLYCPALLSRLATRQDLDVWRLTSTGSIVTPSLSTAKQPTQLILSRRASLGCVVKFPKGVCHFCRWHRCWLTCP